MLRAVEHLVDRALLDDEPAVEDVDAVDDLPDDRKVVRDEEVARARTPRAASRKRFRICAWTETSSAETGSSQTISFGSTASVRAIATRCRSPPDSAAGRRSRIAERQADALEQLVHAGVGAVAREAVDEEHLPERGPDRLGRVECRVRILEDDLNRAPKPPAVLAG